MLIVFNRLIPTEKPLWGDFAFSGESRVIKEQQEWCLFFLTTFLGEASGWLSSGVTLKGVADLFVRAGGACSFPSGKETGSTREVYNEDQRLEIVTALAADVLGPR